MGESICYAPTRDYKVFVRTCTYNQSKYITDTLDGVAMQQTDFPFVHFVMDDASTDGEQDVILSWLNEHCDMTNAEYVDIPAAKVILVNHKTNVNCHYAIYLLKQNLYENRAEKTRLFKPWREHCKYEALCEGDDYWTDPMKLQNQFLIMEANPSVTLCHTAFKFFFTERDCFQDAPIMPGFIGTRSAQKSILDYNFYRVQTCTALFRLLTYQEIIDEYSDCFSSRFLMGDTQLWVLLLSKGDVFYIPDSTAVYRVSKESACRSSNYARQLRFNVSCGEMRLFIMHRLSMPKDELYDKIYREYSINALRYLLISSDYKPMFSLLKTHQLVCSLSHIPVVGNILAKRIANHITIK